MEQLRKENEGPKFQKNSVAFGRKTIKSTDLSIVNKLLAFYRYRRHHYCSFGGREHFHHLAGLFFDFFA